MPGEFPRLEKQLRAAERAAQQRRQEADDAEARAFKLKEQIPIWESLCATESANGLEGLHLTTAVREKLEAAGLTTLGSLLRFWLNATSDEKMAIPGIGDAVGRKIAIALKFAFNAKSPPHLRNPEMSGHYSENDYNWSSL